MKSKQATLIEYIYIILFVLIMFSGATFLVYFVMIMIVILVITLFILAKFKNIKKSAFKSKKDKIIKTIMILLIFFFIFQLTISYNPNITLTFIERFIVYFLLLLYVPTSDLSLKVIKAMKWYSIPVAISIIIQTLITGEKSGGLVGDFQSSGMLMSIAFGIFLIDYYCEKNKSDLLGLILPLLALLTSGKRMFSLLAVIAYILVFLISNDKHKIIKFIKLSILMLLGLIVAYYMIPAVRLVFERLILFSGDKTYNGRIYLWQVGFKIYKNNPIYGIGMGCFSNYFNNFYHRFGNMDAMDAHNIYIQMLAETGIVGMLLVGLFLITNLIKTISLLKNTIIKNSKTKKYVLCYSLWLQVWFILYGLTGNPLYSASQAFFYFSAIAMRIALTQEIELESEVNNG